MVAVMSLMTSGLPTMDISDTTAYGVQATRKATVITPNKMTIFLSISNVSRVKGEVLPHVFFARLALLFISRQILK